MRAIKSASIIGRLYGGWDRIEETVDLPVAIDPVRPRSSIFDGLRGRREELEDGMDGLFCGGFGNGVTRRTKMLAPRLGYLAGMWGDQLDRYMLMSIKTELTLAIMCSAIPRTFTHLSATTKISNTYKRVCHISVCFEDFSSCQAKHFPQFLSVGLYL